MKNMVIYSILVMISLLSNVAIAQSKNKDEIKVKIKENFKDKKVFEKIKSMGRFATVEDDKFYDLGKEHFYRLTGEEFEEDTPKNDSSFEPWNEEVGSSSNYNYSIDDESETIIVNHKGKLFSSVKKNEKLSKDEILEKAHKDMHALLPEKAYEQEYSLNEIARASRSGDGRGPISHTDVAYVVDVQNKIGDVPVRGSKTTFVYFLNGQLQKVRMQRKTIEGSSLSLEGQDEEDIVDMIAEKVSETQFSSLEKIDADVEILVENGRLKKVIVISGTMPGPNGNGPRASIDIEI